MPPPGHRRIFAALLLVGTVALLPFAAGQNARPFSRHWGDQGDGTYANPVLPADFSDIDAIRVGTDYYAISSTLHLSPGMVVLHSKDLVNWTAIGHVVPDVSKLDPNLNWDRMSEYGRGVWAGAIRYRAGRFWVFFNVPSTGFFMSTATNAAGPWEPPHNLWQVSGWDDPCPFWDDDGQGYVVATNFLDGYKVHLFKLAANGRSLLKGFDRNFYQSHGSEASKLYKIGGLYYHLFSEVTDEGRVVKIRRASNLQGPWESRQLIHVNPKIDKEPNQGGLLQTPAGKWYFFTHHGTGDWEGRAASLLPVTWVDRWPVIGRLGSDGIGNMVWQGKNPLPPQAPAPAALSDPFDGIKLGEQWEWNHQPRPGKWSLLERPGYLRLHAFQPLSPGDFWTVGNILSQRSWRTTRNEVVAELDLHGFANRQHAALVHFGLTFCSLGVVQSGGVRRLELNENGQSTWGPEVKQDRIWIRSVWGLDGQSQFFYSLDAKTFTPLGAPYPLTWGRYRGDRVGVFTCNDSGERGYVDLASFRYTIASKN